MASKFTGMSLATAAALIAAVGGSIVFGPDNTVRHDTPKYRPPVKSPNDFGPVIDTTPESKRAKRRRLTREFKRAKRLSTPHTPTGE